MHVSCRHYSRVRFAAACHLHHERLKIHVAVLSQPGAWNACRRLRQQFLLVGSPRCRTTWRGPCKSSTATVRQSLQECHSGLAGDRILTITRHCRHELGALTNAYGSRDKFDILSPASQPIPRPLSQKQSRNRGSNTSACARILGYLLPYHDGDGCQQGEIHRPSAVSFDGIPWSHDFLNRRRGNFF